MKALRLAELVRDRRCEAVTLLEEMVAQLRRVADQDRDRDRLADGPAETEAVEAPVAATVGGLEVSFGEETAVTAVTKGSRKASAVPRPNPAA